MSIESHLVSLRTYLEEIASQNKEILAELKRTGQAAHPAQKTTDAFLAAVTQDTVSKKADKAESKPIPAANVERQLEDETGHDVVKTGSQPPTFVETDKPAPGSKAASTKGEADAGKSPVEVTPETTKPDFIVTIEDEPTATRKSSK
ncbi:MAG: hypothetical protein ACTS5I_13210 [Rhodanobacter sp.]